MILDQLFAIIDEGLSNAKVVLACVSNIYGSSENCKREVCFFIPLFLKKKRIIELI